MRRAGRAPWSTSTTPRTNCARPTRQRDQAIDLQRCLLLLPEDQRAVLLLVALEDLSYAQVAKVLGIPAGTVMSRLSRARTRLQALMDEARRRPPAARPCAASSNRLPAMNTPPPPLDDDDPNAWLAQRDALRQLHREVLDEPVPATLLAAAGAGASRAARDAAWLRWGGMAAAVLIAFGAGLDRQLQRLRATGSSARMARAVPAAREFVHAATVAHAVYAPEKRHPVEVAAAEQQHLLQWLSKRLDRPLRLPDLSAQGYTSGRRPPAAGQPGAQGTVHVRRCRRRTRDALPRQPRRR